MKAGFSGTFVISWSQSEIDGVRAAPVGMLVAGAVWRWTGPLVRVDGPRSVLRLADAEGAADIRRRAARMVARLIGVAQRVADVPADDDDTPPDRSFAVTDGLTCHTVTVLPVPDSAALLLMFVGQPPPSDRDLWVVRAAAQPAEIGPGTAEGVICFTPGTRLRTPEGPRAIEALRPGDLVQTRDSGPQEVLWCGRRHLTGARLHAIPGLRPIRIRAQAFGMARPDADLLVSPQHRMLVRSAAALVLFNTPEVLVRAADLVNDRTVAVDHALSAVTYIHILLPHHHIVWANGLETETFHPAQAALDTIDDTQRAALLAVLPGIDADPHRYGAPARRNLSAPEAAILRHDLVA